MNINQLVKACQKRKPQAERELFTRFAPKVLTICRRYAAHDHDAHDYLQECFMVLFDQLEKFNPDKGAFEGWLYRVCTNTVLQILRKAKSDPGLVLMEELPETQALNEVELTTIPAEMIITAIQQLPTGYRKVFNLHTFENWSHRQIAQELKISESASRSQLTRARKILKTVLKKLKPDNYERRLA